MELFKCFLLYAIATLCALTYISAAPLAEKENTANRDKRSGEVIFFENAQKRGEEVKKRSDGWRLAKSDDASAKKPRIPEKAQASQQNSVKNEGADNGKLTLNKADLSDEKMGLIFETAVDYVVDKLINELYQEELTDDDYFVNQPTKEAATIDFKPPTKTTIRLQQNTASPVKQDDAAMSLSSLTAKRYEKPDQHSKLKVDLREDDSSVNRANQDVMDWFKGNFKENDNNMKRLALKTTEMPTGSNNDERLNMVVPDSTGGSNNDEKLNMVVPDSTGGSNKDDELITEDFMKEMSNNYRYLQQLSGLEEKLRSALDSYKKLGAPVEKLKEDSESEGRVHSRKRRSVSGGWYGNGMKEYTEDGVYFNGQEVRELRDILLKLAKERLDSEKLINYLTSQKEPIVIEPEADEWAKEDKDVSKLENLAFQLEQRRMPTGYQSYQQASPKRSFSRPVSSLMKK